MKLNKEEFLIGIMYILVFTLWIKIFVLILAPISGFLWALTGSDSKYNWKLWRQLGCPLLVCLGIWLGSGINTSWAVPVSTLFLHMGYGIPDSTDKGSTLGKFFLKLSNNEDIANILTRSTIYVGAVLPFIALIFKGTK